MAAIAYFEKAVEDGETVTYRYGFDEEVLEHSFTISKAEQRPITDPEQSTMAARLAFTAIIKGYRKQGSWPERGAGYT